MSEAYKKIKVAIALGPMNLARVFVYRLGVRFGINSVRRLQAELPPGPYFQDIFNKTITELPPPSHWLHEAFYFGNFPVPVSSDSPPDWHLNPINGARVFKPERSWWDIPDFDPLVGDIKPIWEASRFDWVLAFAQRIRSGNSVELVWLNNWLSDWCVKNPPYHGPNWKCGQEASIRVMHLAIAALLLGQTDEPNKSLIDLVKLHLQRIAPTVSYAIAQDNNHGTSEAAALFIGGSWMERLGLAEGAPWQRLGRKWLENRVARLIGLDGSFSQYSLNYHRMLIDTLSIVEIWLKHLNLPEFSSQFQLRAAAAARWLAAMVDPLSGDAPNLGANDGAHLLPLTNADYRDFRPSVQLAMALFNGECAYENDSPSNEQLAWLDVSLPKRMAAPSGSQVFDDGGYGILRRGDSMAMLRYPRFRFRPSQADALHVDLWHKGENLLRDAGTYGYNADPQWLTYFPGTISHNTVQFDGRDQMPRLSRFLFGDWLKTENLFPLTENKEETTFGAVYRDGYGARHQRLIRLLDARMIVQDRVEGLFKKAVLRWRVRPGNWILKGQSLTDGEHILSVKSSAFPTRVELTSGWESRYYLEKTPVPVLEVEICEPAVLTTEYQWAS